MLDSRKLLLSFFLISVVGLAVLPRHGSDLRGGATLVQPADLAKELSELKGPKPTIL